VSLFDLCQHQNVITHLFTRAYGHLRELLLKSVFFYIYIYIGQLVHYGHLVRPKVITLDKDIIRGITYYFAYKKEDGFMTRKMT